MIKDVSPYLLLLLIIACNYNIPALSTSATCFPTLPTSSAFTGAMAYIKEMKCNMEMALSCKNHCYNRLIT